MRQAVLLPERQGLERLRKMQKVLFDPFVESVGFDPTRTWGVLSGEIYEGPLDRLYEFLHQLQEVLEQLNYKDRKTFVWAWERPEASVKRGDTKSSAVLQMLHVPEDAQKPTDMSQLEFVDVHSQLLGKIGFELLRIDELIKMWCLAAESKMRIVTAGVSRSLVESVAAFYELSQRVESHWNLCKEVLGEVVTTDTGGRVNRERAEAAQQLRECLWASRHELKLNDSLKDPTLEPRLAEWRHRKLFPVLASYGIKHREQSTVPPSANLLKMVRDLSAVTEVDGESKVLMTDYELLCNVVHPSMGGLRLYSSPEYLDDTYMFALTLVGKKQGKVRYDPRNKDSGVTAFGIFANSISRSAIVSLQVYISLISRMIAIADDIALTADVEPYTLHRSWRYPNRSDSTGCKCEWSRHEPCKHEWRVNGPQVPGVFQLTLDPLRSHPQSTTFHRENR